MAYFDREYPPLTSEQIEVMRKLDKTVGELLDKADAEDAEAILEGVYSLDNAD